VAREIVLSASAMFLAIVLPQVLLLFIWKVQLVKVFEIFSFANAQHRFFEILAALIPLVILEAIIGVIFMMDSRLNSVLNRLITMPFLNLIIVNCSFQHGEEHLPPALSPTQRRFVR
jgi:hypothetical protein